MSIETNSALPPRPDDIDSGQNRRIAAENERVQTKPKKESWFSRHPVWTVILVLVAVSSSIGSAINEASQHASGGPASINPPAFTASDGTTLSSAEVAGIDAGWDQQSDGRQRLICESLQKPAERATMEDVVASQMAGYDVSPDEVSAVLEYIDQQHCQASL